MGLTLARQSFGRTPLAPFHPTHLHSIPPKKEDAHLTMGGCKDCGAPAHTEVTAGDKTSELATSSHPLILIQHGPIAE